MRVTSEHSATSDRGDGRCWASGRLGIFSRCDRTRRTRFVLSLDRPCRPVTARDPSFRDLVFCSKNQTDENISCVTATNKVQAPPCLPPVIDTPHFKSLTPDVDPRSYKRGIVGIRRSGRTPLSVLATAKLLHAQTWTQASPRTSWQAKMTLLSFRIQKGLCLCFSADQCQMARQLLSGSTVRGRPCAAIDARTAWSCEMARCRMHPS